MKTYRKLQRLGSKEPLPCHFNTVVATIERVLGHGSTDPHHYKEADYFAEKYLAYNLRRKEATPYGVKVSSQARRAETLAGFLLRESVNRKINSTRTFGYDPFTGEYSSDLVGLRLLYDARSIIARILGQAPSLERIFDSCDYGNGASAALCRNEAQRQRKFEHGMCVTGGLLAFIHQVVKKECPAWSALLGAQKDTFFVDRLGNTSFFPKALKRVSGAVLDFVPKTKDVDRIILKEPELNGFVQKGIGREIRRKLRQWREVVPDGIDLNTSGDLNSGLAKAGSEHGLIATVDAERASDSITLVLCEFLLPEKWYNLLCAARSPYAIINGKHHHLAMMSGMGNGFTFELESVIFYAIGLACAKRSKIAFAEQMVSIHGDDLTIPADVMWHVTAAYKAAGIRVNKGKSFSQGPFRESCGGHFFNGRSVKPFYVKDQTGVRRGDWIWLANSLLLWLADRSPSYLNTSKGKDLFELLAYLRRYATSYSRRDWYFRSSFDRSRRSGIYSLPPKSHGSSYRCRQCVDVPRVAKFTDAQAYVAWLCSPQVSPTPHELLFGTRPTASAYEFNTEVDERERTVRFNTWHVPSNGDGWPPLWAALHLHEGRHY